MEQHNFEEFVLPGKAKLQVDMDLGSVTIRSHQADTIQITGESSQMDVLIVQEGNTVYLDVNGGDQPQGWLSWLTGKADNGEKTERPSATFTIYTPTDCDLKVSNTAGQVTVEEIGGAVKARVTAGEILLHDLGNTVDAKTVAGRIAYRGILVDESHRFDVVTGEIDLKLNKQPNAEIDFKAVVGDANCRFDFEGSAKKQGFLGRRVRGTVGSGEGHIRARVVTGAIRIHPVKDEEVTEKEPLKIELQGEFA